MAEKVVCIDDSLSPENGWRLVPPVKKGVVYTIRERRDVRGTKSVALEEMLGKIDPVSRMECLYRASRFAPVKKTNIEIFREIDRKVFNGVPVNA